MNDHIPDATKMISDTPRTDEQINGKPCTRFEILAGDSLRNAAVPSEFARNLERELNGANELIVRLQAVTNDPHALWANWLRGSVTLPVGIGDVREYQDRIKRLEEAGNQMELVLISFQIFSDFRKSDSIRASLNWNKAKEVKP
jgi:hypothetical protein